MDDDADAQHAGDARRGRDVRAIVLERKRQRLESHARHHAVEHFTGHDRIDVLYDDALGDGRALRSITLNLPSSVTAPAGSAFRLTHCELELAAADRAMSSCTRFRRPATYSRVELNSLSVIEVSSVDHYNAAYSGGAITTAFNRGATVYVRSVVSDPFGSFDIAGANLSILDPSSTTIVNNVAMTQVADSGAATRTYEYAFTVPTNAAAGAWSTRVVAREGTENTVTDLGVGAFNVVLPALSMQKDVRGDLRSDQCSLEPEAHSRQRGALHDHGDQHGRRCDRCEHARHHRSIAERRRACVLHPSAAACWRSLMAHRRVRSRFTYASNVTYSSAPRGGAPYSYTPAPYSGGLRPEHSWNTHRADRLDGRRDEARAIRASVRFFVKCVQPQHVTRHLSRHPRRMAGIQQRLRLTRSAPLLPAPANRYTLLELIDS